MKCQVPQISWHGRDPVLSIDFQPIKNDVLRLASGGTDSHVLIWYVTCQGNKSIKLECASDLYRHNKAVNVVRFSPKGDILVSGDDDGDMYVWELKEREQMIDPPNDDENLNKEDWYPIKSLRAHLDDIYDLSWSKDGNFLVSSSLDNSAVLWDMQKYSKLYTFNDFKGYVQGVSYDPLNQYIASIGIDRMLRVHDINSKKTACKVSYAPWTYSTEKGTIKARLFHDDTLQSFFRRLTFTPDGELLIVPSGIVEKGEEKTSNACYVFSRHALNKPVIKLPTGDKYTVAVKCNPHLYKLRPVHNSSDKENEPAKSMIKLPYRMIFAVAASDSVLLYDTEQMLPFAYVSNIHYTHLTDLSWSPDGLTLVVSSTDGYCSFILFTQDELGEIYIPEEPKEILKESDKSEETSELMKMDTSEPATPTSKHGAGEKKNTPDIKHSVGVKKNTPDIKHGVGVKKNTPDTTPKRITPTRVESSVPTSSAKDESVTPSQKNGKNSDKKNSKKSPKMMSIKNFFTSPKTVPSSSNSPCKNANETPSKVVKEDNDSIEIIDVAKSPHKSGCSCNSCVKQMLNYFYETKEAKEFHAKVGKAEIAKKLKGKAAELDHQEQSKCALIKSYPIVLKLLATEAGKEWIASIEEKEIARIPKASEVKKELKAKAAEPDNQEQSKCKLIKGDPIDLKWLATEEGKEWIASVVEKEIARLPTAAELEKKLKAEAEKELKAKAGEAEKELKAKAAEPMEVDENPPDDQKKEPLPAPSVTEKRSKCKVRLDFTDKDQLMANIDDNASDSNSLSCDVIVDNKNESKEVNENDWRLELSQDDDIPMKTNPVQTESGPEVSKDKLTASSKKSETTKTVEKTDKNSSESKQKPTKRRISFVTLSSKPTFKK